ncbi:hypothetical protein [Streptomyces sp. NPDC051636]|uniref:hypothetical protein n=1 Tax=Streptomyces sp. NPDC051636 TaxID=3365663 RepID=UPI003793D9C1
MASAAVRPVRLARHTCGTLLAFLKAHPKVAQAILRHSRISMTMDVYTHVVGSDEREAVAMLAELLEIHSSVDVSHRCQRPPGLIAWGSFRWWG